MLFGKRKVMHMFCNQCRSSIPDGSRYCNFCGACQQGRTSSGKSWLKGLVVVAAVLLAFRMGNTFSSFNADTSETGKQPFVAQDQQKISQEISLQTIPTTWSAEPRQLGDGGYCWVLETVTPVNQCRQVTLTLEAEGNYGATTQGNWEVQFRIGGQWKKIQTVYYSGSGEESFTICFSPSATFDAVCAFPTQRGNYSYQSSMALSDAYCD